MDGNNLFLGERLSDKDLIESVLASFYILDYGFIKKVNQDNTIDVTHAKRLKTLNGQSLKATVTTGVEVLNFSGGGFSFKFDYKQGDKVLLLGLKNYVPKVDEVNSATETTEYMHYTRETLKAIPMCVFNGDATVTVEVKEGSLTIETEKDVTVKAGGNITAQANGDVNIEAKGNATVKSPNTKLTGGIVEIGGAVTPTGQGALCGIPYCVYSGAPHAGKQTAGA